MKKYIMLLSLFIFGCSEVFFTEERKPVVISIEKSNYYNNYKYRVISKIHIENNNPQTLILYTNKKYEIGDTIYFSNNK